MSNKTNKKESKTFIEEYRERLNREDLERLWKLEALDCLFTEAENQPESFHRLWIQPLVTAGVNLEAAAWSSSAASAQINPIFDLETATTPFLVTSSAVAHQNPSLQPRA